MNRGHSLYYFTDKHVFDALIDNKFGKRILLERLREKGIFLSDLSTKESLREYCSLVFLNYFDSRFISDVLDQVTRKEKYSVSELSHSYDPNTFEDVCKDIINGMNNNEKNSGEVVNYYRSKDGTLNIEVSYIEPDFTKNIMAQNITKVGTIRLESDINNNTIITTTDDNKAKIIAKNIFSGLQKKTATPIEELSINLTAIPDCKKRTSFFLKIIESVPDFELLDVASVSVSHISSYIDESDEESEEEKELSTEISGFIRKAILNGDSVLNSPEFQNLDENRFYITKISWTAKQRKPKGDKIDFVAEFKNTAACSDFCFAPMRTYKQKKDGSFNIGSASLSEFDKDALIPLLHQAAKESYLDIIADTQT